MATIEEFIGYYYIIANWIDLAKVKVEVTIITIDAIVNIITIDILD